MKVCQKEQVGIEFEPLTEEATKKSIYTVLISGGNQNPVTIIIKKYQYGDAVVK